MLASLRPKEPSEDERAEVVLPRIVKIAIVEPTAEGAQS